MSSSFTDLASQPQSNAMALPSRHRSPQADKRSTTASRHFCFSWAVSGADDTSPCCEQFNVLRIGPSTPHRTELQTGRIRGRGRFHWGKTIPAGGRIQELSALILRHVFPRQHSVSFRRHLCEGLTADNSYSRWRMPADLPQLQPGRSQPRRWPIHSQR